MRNPFARLVLSLRQMPNRLNGLIITVSCLIVIVYVFARQAENMSSPATRHKNVSQKAENGDTSCGRVAHRNIC
jgi:hypothetical protein